MAEVTRIPRWLELQAEIDYRIFLLNEMRRELEAENERLTPLDRLIDEATGLDEGRLAEAREIIAEIEVLKAEWDRLASGDGSAAFWGGLAGQESLYSVDVREVLGLALGRHQFPGAVVLGAMVSGAGFVQLVALPLGPVPEPVLAGLLCVFHTGNLTRAMPEVIR